MPIFSIDLTATWIAAGAVMAAYLLKIFLPNSIQPSLAFSFLKGFNLSLYPEFDSSKI
jgi:hypothetical protein